MLVEGLILYGVAKVAGTVAVIKRVKRKKKLSKLKKPNPKETRRSVLKKERLKHLVAN